MGIPKTKNNKLIKEILKHTEVCMMTTQKGGMLLARPMYMQKAEFDGELWFFTYDDSDKAKEIKNDDSINLSFTNEKKNSYLSMAGKGSVVHDKVKAKELWNPLMKAWFKDGLDTEGLALLKFTPNTAEYWDSPDSDVVELLAMTKAAITGKKVKGDKNDTVSF